MYARYGKRLLDLILSAVALTALSLVMLVIAAAIRCDDGGRVIFRQRRVGKLGKSFELLKFRSMPENTGDIPSELARQVQPTRVGRFIRRTNLDELPQLLNILRGEMSLVGPRPALPSQQVLLDRRISNGASQCLPGLTGLAQVNATEGMSSIQKAEWDGRYASNVKLSTDVVVIARTFVYLLSPPPTY
jgi:O-antigen biosynthesis protein WbqP